MPLPVQDVTETLEDSAIHVFAIMLLESFRGEPFDLACFGDAPDQVRHWCFASFIAAARAVGRIFIIEQDAIALVYPPGQHSYGSELERTTSEELKAQALFEEYDPEQQAYYNGWFDEQYDQFKEEAYGNGTHTNGYHIHILGVRASKQGQGMGKALMQHIQLMAIKEGKKLYIEAASRANCNLYIKLGFKLAHTASFQHTLAKYNFTFYLLQYP